MINKVLTGQILRLVMGFVFLSAGLYRLFFPMGAQLEMATLGLPNFISWLVVIIEIVGGSLLLLGKYKKVTSVTLIIFLLLAIIQGFVINGENIWLAVGELFVFNANPTDIFLHLLFIIILVLVGFATMKPDADHVPNNRS